MCGIVIAKGINKQKTVTHICMICPFLFMLWNLGANFVKTFNGHKSVYKKILYNYEVMAKLSVLEGDYLLLNEFK